MLHFLCNNGFRVGMLEVNNYKRCFGMSVAVQDTLRDGFSEHQSDRCKTNTSLKSWHFVDSDN